MAPMRLLRPLLVVNALALLAVAVWLRWSELASVPGLNGDEAWYGVQAVELLRGGHYLLRTPNGLPVNPLFFGPLVLAHCVFPPSILTLRSVAFACGLVTLVINYALARWLWDRPSAMFSTLVLAVLPVNILYSRLAWDSCLSVAATLAVLYLALGAVRQPERGKTLLTAATAALAVAALVHPTNLILGVALVPAAVIVRPDLGAAWRTPWTAIKQRPLRTVSAAAAVALLAAIVAGYAARQPKVQKVVGNRLHRVAQWTKPAHVARSVGIALVRYPRLFMGGTPYRFTAGSGSALEWPAGREEDRPGADVVLFWILIAGAAWLMWRWGRRPEDTVLLAGWMLQLGLFLVVGGVDSLKPHYERYALCLIAPALALVTRGAMIAVERRPGVLAAGAIAASVAGWVLLADCQRSFFDFIHQTGGRSHLAFSAARLDPKQSALEYLIAQRQAGRATGVRASEWWTYWPMRYLAPADPGFHIVLADDANTDRDFQAALSAGRAWLVELSCDEDPRPAVSSRYEVLERRCFRDFAGHPVVHVLRVARAEPAR